MEEILSFVLAVKSAVHNFADLCRRFEISRVTGYKWWNRFRALGLEGLYKRSCRAHFCPHQTGARWRRRVANLRGRRPHWGPKKLRAKLEKTYGSRGLPAASTMGRILVAKGLVRSRRRRRPGPAIIRPGLTLAQRSNHVWAVDFKGWFRTGNGRRCDPLTVTDLFSRYLLGCQVVARPRDKDVRPHFRRWFRWYGMPETIRVDNGPPFGSTGAGGLTSLSVWWLRLGIDVEYITPGRPQENGCHERMHRTLKAETTRPPARNSLAQQERFTRWQRDFNRERPHEALGQQVPQSVYEHSPRRYREPVREVEYPVGSVVRRVRHNGQIKWRGRFRFIGEAFSHQSVRLVPAESGRQAVYFCDWLLGELDENKHHGIRATVRVGRRASAKLKKALRTFEAAARGRRSRGRGESVTRSDRRSRELEAQSSWPSLARPRERHATTTRRIEKQNE